MSVRAVAAPTRADLDAAAAIVAAHLVPTPLIPSPALGDGVHLKLETFQPTGSFKVRGGLAALARAGGGAPVVTASAGNAGLGVAWAASVLGVQATIVVAEDASPAKVAALKALPVTLVQHGAGYDAAELHALGLTGATYVSSYNDTGVIAGQATIGRELDVQLPGPVDVAAPLGGGSLASGLGLWASGRAGARVLGVEAARSAAFSTALAAGEITPFAVGDTLADGLAGNLEPGAVTFGLVRDHLAAVEQASEAEIGAAIRFLAQAHGIVAEGAGATAVAAVLAGRIRPGDAPLVVIVSGRNIALERLSAVLAAA